jgi:HD-like signal output (HDOD) protein
MAEERQKRTLHTNHGEVDLEFAEEVLLEEDEVTERLRQTFSAPDYRPPTMPSVATELMGLAQDPDVDFDDVVGLLEQDSVLTGQVMKLMQSVAYSGQVQITSLKQALVRMGLKELRDLVLAASLDLRVFRSAAYSGTMERLRLHSLVTANLSRIICKYTAIEGEYAFLCGLMHDVGVAGILIALSEKAGRGEAPDLIAIWPVIHEIHAEAAVLMAKHWKLPSEIQMVIGAHHQVLIEGYPHPLAATVCLAEDMAHELGVGLIPAGEDEAEGLTAVERACLSSHTGVDRSGPKTLEHAKGALQLSEAQLELIRDDAEDLVADLA